MVSDVKVIKIAVVGCGKIAEKHLSAYQKLEGVDVTATDIDPRGEKVAHDYGVEWHADPFELMQRPDINAVDVCTPTPSHASTIMTALDARKHVFCEKPLAQNLDEVKKIQERAARADSLLMVGYLYRFHPAFKFAKNVLESSLIGDPYLAFLRLGGRGSHRAWKHLRTQGGGAANEMLVHTLDLALWYFGDAKDVETVFMDTILREREVEDASIEADAEDIIIVKLGMENGTTVFCESDLITPSYMNTMEIQGTNGSLFTSILDYMPTMLYLKEPRGIYDRGRNMFHFPKVDLFEKELSYFVDCIRNQLPPDLNSLADSMRLMEILELSR